MRCGIVGCGNMGKGIAQRLALMEEVFLFDKNRHKAEELAAQGYGQAVGDLRELVEKSEIIILAVKPQNFVEAASAMKVGEKRVVSVLAGTTLSMLHKYFSHVIRMMPNLPLVYGEGVIGLAGEYDEQINKVFQPLGMVVWLPEEKIDAITSLAGSGPAFFYTMLEAMVDAGMRMGFTKKEAEEIAIQMVRGSLTLLERSGKEPEELKVQIASPKGTTEAGLKKMVELDLHEGIVETFLAAFKRAKELQTER